MVLREFGAHWGPGVASSIAVLTGFLNPPEVTVAPASAEEVQEHPFFVELAKAPVKALDLETTGLDPLRDELVCITLAMPGLTAIFHPSHIELLRPVIEQGKQWLIQHAPFDCGFLYAKYGIRLHAGHVYDTRLAEQQWRERINGTASTSLASQADRYLNIDMKKELATGFKVDQPLSLDQATYTALDAQILFPLAMQHLLRHRILKPENLIGLSDMYAYVDAQGALPLPQRS